MCILGHVHRIRQLISDNDNKNTITHNNNMSRPRTIENDGNPMRRECASYVIYVESVSLLKVALMLA